VLRARLTRQTDVVDFEVVVEFDVAWSPVSKGRFDDVQRAPSSSCTAAVKNIEHVDVAADVAEVSYHTAADLHSAVDRSPDDDYLSRAVAERVEPSVVTVLPGRHRRV